METSPSSGLLVHSDEITSLSSSCVTTRLICRDGSWSNVSTTHSHTLMWSSACLSMFCFIIFLSIEQHAVSRSLQLETRCHLVGVYSVRTDKLRGYTEMKARWFSSRTRNTFTPSNSVTFPAVMVVLMPPTKLCSALNSLSPR